MADIIKMKPKKTYEWNQDKKFVYVQIPLPAHTSLKKVQIYLSDLILRVTSLEKKNTHSLDLLYEVDYRSPQNKFILTNGHLHATLKKTVIDQSWQTLLVEELSLADLKVRRRESEQRYEQNVKNIEENKDKLRIDYDRKATQQLMRFEQVQRDKLEERKQAEKDSAIRQVFSNINDKTGRIEKPHKILEIGKLQRDEEKWNEKQQIALQILQNQQQAQRTNYFKQTKQKNQEKIIEQVKKQYGKQVSFQNNTMFTDEQIDKLQEMREKVNQGIQYDQIPVRKGENQKVTFTEKIYPGLAARDTFYKDPPLPKNKGGKGSQGDFQSKNPLWLKDKGDSFFKDKNYISAIEAYSEAIKIDSKLIKAYLNRSLSYLKVFRLSEAIGDCNQCLVLMQAQIVGSEQESHSRLTFAKIKTRKAICLAWKGELEQSKILLNQVLQLELDEQIKNQINSCLQHIKNRQLSIQSKTKGDDLVKLNNHQAAVTQYDKSISIDQNQYAISNKVLCLNKLKDYKESIDLAERGIKKISNFNVGTASKQDKQSSIILLKLYYREAKAHEQLNEINEAEETIRKGITINSEDKQMQEFLKIIKKKQSKLTLKTLKEASIALIKQSKIKEALENYSKCLKLIEQQEEIQQYLAILQNQCVCYQKLEKYDDVLSTCIRILKIVNNIQSKVLVFGGKREIPIEKEEIKRISVRTLVRRANAYIKTNQYYNAKADFEKALQLSPDEQIRKQLEKVNQKLKEELQK